MAANPLLLPVVTPDLAEPRGFTDAAAADFDDAFAKL